MDFSSRIHTLVPEYFSNLGISRKPIDLVSVVKLWKCNGFYCIPRTYVRAKDTTSKAGVAGYWLLHFRDRCSFQVCSLQVDNIENLFRCTRSMYAFSREICVTPSSLTCDLEARADFWCFRSRLGVARSSSNNIAFIHLNRCPEPSVLPAPYSSGLFLVSGARDCASAFRTPWYAMPSVQP